MKPQFQRLICLALVANLFSCSFFQTGKHQPIEPQAPTETSKPPAPVKTGDAAQSEVKSTTATEAANDAKSEYSAYDLQATAADSAAQVQEKGYDVKPSFEMSAGAFATDMAVGRSATTLGKKMAGANSYFPHPSINSLPTSNESYDGIQENTFHKASSQALSTFSIDVDTASYSNMRRMLQQKVQPPADAIRVEELINYFNYDYAAPEKDAFSVNMEMAPALWNKKHKIVRIGIKGKEMKIDKRPASNLVFLIDVSGSMESSERLPLVKSALNMLIEKMTENDKISIVVYAGAAGLVLPPTPGNQKMKIIRALDQLQAGGSTNGSGGIELAYKTATEQFIKGGVNRVILATDGDFNVGVTSRDELVQLVQKNAKKNIYLSILGFGMGNYKDGMMETLSNKGNGNYAYIDTQSEARKVMVEQLSGTLVTIAKDVKIQVEFNPRFVESYRLVGYENRVLKNEDFNNDKKDAGDIGAGHTVTALYEIVPVGSGSQVANSVDALKYQKTKVVEVQNDSKEWMTVKLRYKKPDGDTSTKIEFPLEASDQSFDKASESFRFASAVALFGMILRNSEHVQEGSYKDVIATAKKAKGSDVNAYREEFIDLVKKAQDLKELNLGNRAQVMED